MIPARLRAGAQWADACILNISSRGLLIHSGRAGPEGSMVELRKGDHVIVARVVWRDGSRVGLRSDDRLPIEDILSVGDSGALRLVASEGALVDRRGRRRLSADSARLRGRAMELIGGGAISLCLVLGIWTMAREALARPMARIELALSGHPQD